MNFKELERIIKADGWELKNVTGSHHHYKHALKSGGNLDIKTVNSVLRQASLKR